MSAFGGDALQRKAMSHKSSFIIIDNYIIVFYYTQYTYKRKLYLFKGGGGKGGGRGRRSW